MSDLPDEQSVMKLIPSNEAPAEEPTPTMKTPKNFKIELKKYWAILALVTYIAGLGSGYELRELAVPSDTARGEEIAASKHNEMEILMEEVNPPDGYTLPVQYGDFAPELVAAGVIDYDRFVKLYQEIGAPLSEEQITILTEGSDAPVVIHQDNKQFLLNLFWALGLANQNPILTEGNMIRNGEQQVMNFASTGGWTLASKPVGELYASLSIISLTQEQQQRLEEVSAGVYRPCCDNPTHFPDCNHGMAMLGLLELMAANDASMAEMFDAAKYVSAFWFPQQALELAVLFKNAKNVEFSQANASQVVGKPFFSGSGYQAVNQWLVQKGMLEQIPNGGGSCGVK